MSSGSKFPARVALLTNFVQPYRRPLFRAIGRSVGHLRVLISTSMEENRPWLPDETGLDVVRQHSFFLTRLWRHPSGFSEDVYIHVPYDTLWQLWRYRPDVVISGQMGFQTLMAYIYRCLRPSSRLILMATISERSEKGRGRLRHWLRRFLLPRMDAALANGVSGVRYLQNYGIRRENIFIAPYTMDYEPFLTIPLNREGVKAKRLLYSGQFVARKGIIPFLRVLIAWCQQHSRQVIELWLVGDGPVRTELEREKLPSNLELRFIGSIPYNELHEVYAHCGILVLPTLADEWGMVVNEAMAAGMPVLGSLYSQAVEELIVDGETGWTYRVDDINSVYSALSKALGATEESLIKMRLKARGEISKLTPDFVAQQLLDAITHVRT